MEQTPEQQYALIRNADGGLHMEAVEPAPVTLGDVWTDAPNRPDYATTRIAQLTLEITQAKAELQDAWDQWGDADAPDTNCVMYDLAWRIDQIEQAIARLRAGQPEIP
ncbi:hypothetical protein DYU11_20210 [Fibrisoma montanum]|uniref:Uncharacterized protein n=1 Tax=Fibrisoma montanum TaxID=2305895 RepID=A0A418M3H4_9BACT|nr:hypothetical protein [Fibrisoma montanum]RIV20377.1 hypothetical protein DYU11_20210 [Fibrisoma montanum]